MASTSSDQTITLERVHFETILRRANFNPEDANSPTPGVTISQTEYDGLNRIAAQYKNLRQNLLRGGVNEETIALLSQDDQTIQEQQQTAAAAPAPATAPAPAANANVVAEPLPSRRSAPFEPRSQPAHNDSYRGQPKAPRNGGQVHYTQDTLDWADADTPEDDESVSGGGGAVGDFNQDQGYQDHSPVNGRPYYERQCARSILLTNLAEGTAHSDITDAVRGGQLLDVHLRQNERTATVSFLQAADARAFFEHVRRHDLYIKQKRVDVRWSDRHFTLPGHVASKIGSGATRNLVVRRCGPSMTEAAIREDLDHIHNLVVIKVDFIGGSCHIKTNSVHNAMFARTCMMSRLKYKHQKIDWDADECCQPFEVPAPSKMRKDSGNPKKSSGNGMANRFHLLNLDEDEDEDDMAPAFGATKAMGITA